MNDESKVVELSAAYMLALHNFDMDAVRKTATYQAMVVEYGEAKHVDAAIEQICVCLRHISDDMPEKCAKLMQDITEHVRMENSRGGETVKFLSEEAIRATPHTPDELKGNPDAN
jgi:hypothetical protein